MQSYKKRFNKFLWQNFTSKVCESKISYACQMSMNSQRSEPIFLGRFLNDSHLTPPPLHPDSRAVQLRGLPAGVEHPVERQVCRWVRLHLRVGGHKEKLLGFSKKKFKGGSGGDLEFCHEKSLVFRVCPTSQDHKKCLGFVQTASCLTSQEIRTRSNRATP